MNEAADEAAPEAAIFDEVAGVADLTAKVNEAWREFASQLAAVLPAQPDGVTIDITLDPTASGTGDAVYGVQLQVTGEVLVGSAVSNADLPKEFRLNRAAVAGLVALGWSPPGVVAETGESFGARYQTTESNRVAAMVSRTLRDVYGAPHPAFLTYLVRGGDGAAPVAGPALGAARPLVGSGRAALGDDGALSALDSDEATAERALVDLVAGVEEAPLVDRVAAVVARLLKTTPDALSLDPDGDIGIRAGSAMVFVRVRDNPPLIDVFSPVLTNVQPTQQLYAKLSELTNRMPIGRLYCADDTVWASVPVFGRDFQPSHLMLAVQVMTGLADELDDRLAGEFGGRRFFGETERPEINSEAERTGMYL